MYAIPPDAARLLRRQDGALTTPQALAAGMTERQLRTLRAAGWRCAIRGTLISPDAPDPFRAVLRAALLTYPQAIASGFTAARLHDLWGLPRWTPAEVPQLLLPAGATFDQRPGVRLASGFAPEERTVRVGFPVATLPRTVQDVAPRLAVDDSVCLFDDALARGWSPTPGTWSRRTSRRLNRALALADPRSESVFETLLRLLLIRAGLAPETLQFRVRDEAGRVVARLDLAWPSIRLGVEADGVKYHDTPEAAYRDRGRGNQLLLRGWRILRFTWADMVRRPEWVVELVRRALQTTSTDFPSF